MPSIEKLHRDHSKKGLALLTINDEDLDVAQGFVKKNNYTFPVLSDKAHVVREHYGVTGIPTTVILDRKGRLIAQPVGTRSEQTLLRLLRRAGLK